jgi:PEP-CTERM motif
MKISVLLLISLPACGGAVIFSDLGTGSNVYNTSSNSWGVEGSNNTFSPGIAQGIAALFTAGGSGSEAVGQIDLGMWYFGGLNTFTASIWTDVAGAPGSQVAGAFWGLSTSNVYNNCCVLATVSGISGVTLTGGQQYFMILQPVSYSDTSTNGWAYNSQGVSADIQSTQNGSIWFDQGSSANYAAFDVLGAAAAVPEPGTLLLIGAGVAAVVLKKRMSAQTRAA